MSNGTVNMGSNQCMQMYPTNDTSTAPKKKAPRKNPWGNSSYADLITQAIETSPEKKLTLSQIYDWMIRNVPHFSNQGASNSSAGWKNSIRHNLSLHERFYRLKGEETSGKSSWWTVNKAAGTGRTSRRKNSGKKRGKNQISPHKTLLKKLSNSNPPNQLFSSTAINETFQNLPNFPNSTNDRSLTRSSTSSEDNESLQSIGSSYSPSCNENEMIYKETFQRNNETNKRFLDLPPVHTCDGDYTNSSYSNMAYLCAADAVNNNALNTNGIEMYYPSFNKLYSKHNNLLNPSYDYTMKSMPIDEAGFSAVSAEYFKSPHHLSGSYMTSEVSKMDNIYTNASVLDKPDPILITDLSSHIVHESPNLKESLDSNQNSVFLSPESQNFMKVPFISDYPLEVNNNFSLNTSDQNHSEESSVFLEKENAGKMQKNNHIPENNFDFYCTDPQIVKAEPLQEETDEFSDLAEQTLKHNQDSDSLASPNYFGSDTTDHEYLNQIPGYLSEQESVDNTDSNEIIQSNEINNVIILQPEKVEYRKQYSEQIKGKYTIYKTRHLIAGKQAERQTSPKAKGREVCPNEERLYDFPGVEEIPLQSIVHPNENALDNSSEREKNNALDSDLSASYKSECAGLDKRKNRENEDYSSNALKRSKLDCSPQVLECDINKLNTFPFQYNSTTKSSEIEKTGKSIFHQHLDFITYHMVKLVMLLVENLEQKISAVNSTFVFLHTLSLQTSQKKFLVVLTELFFTLKLSYKCHDENGSVIYSNYNSFFEDLIFSHFGYDIDFISIICLYVNALDAFVSEDFAEKYLEESTKKYNENHPNLIRYLKLYVISTPIVENIINGNLIKQACKEGCTTNFDNFVPSSTCNKKNMHEIFVDIKIMWNRKDSYVSHIEYFIRRRFLENDTKIHASFHPSLNILRNFLDTIKLQPKLKLLSSDLVTSLIDTEKLKLLKNDNLKESLNHKKETVKLVKNVNILPGDLSDIQLIQNFELDHDFQDIDFEFSSYDASYDKYL